MTRRPGADQGPPSWLADVPLAHRGLHGPGVPENSLAAFDAASAAGVGVELDVWLSADGVPVVLHDRDLRRVTGDPRVVGAVTVGELARLRLDGGDQHVPTLAEVLALLGDAPVMVEVKNPGTRAGPVEAAVAEVAEDHRGPWCAASFNPRSVAWFATHAPEVVRVQTAGTFDGVGMPPPLRWALRTLRFVGATRPHAVSYDVRAITAPAVQRYRRDGGVVLAWTVRTSSDLATARAMADNVIFEALAPAEVLADQPEA